MCPLAEYHGSSPPSRPPRRGLRDTDWLSAAQLSNGWLRMSYLDLTVQMVEAKVGSLTQRGSAWVLGCRVRDLGNLFDTPAFADRLVVDQPNFKVLRPPDRSRSNNRDNYLVWWSRSKKIRS